MRPHTPSASTSVQARQRYGLWICSKRIEIGDTTWQQKRIKRGR
jgi:hypothetical protein